MLGDARKLVGVGGWQKCLGPFAFEAPCMYLKCCGKIADSLSSTTLSLLGSQLLQMLRPQQMAWGANYKRVWKKKALKKTPQELRNCLYWKKSFIVCIALYCIVWYCLCFSEPCWCWQMAVSCNQKWDNTCPALVVTFSPVPPAVSMSPLLSCRL